MVPVFFHGKFDVCNSVINSVCMFCLYHTLFFDDLLS